MIPKKIHYFWFGKGKKSALTEICIQSWKKTNPAFEIVEWTEDNFDVQCNTFVREAYEKKKWAFVSDYARAKVLFDEGGFYLDTDMELKLPLDEFVIEKAIPVVRYNWNDSLSMADNNSYSFCYRDITYSRHAHGMAIDINPRFNPLRWKKVNRPNKPSGALSDTTVNGTLYPGHPVVKAFTEKGFYWGHRFSKYYDDHHFEKR